MINKISIKTSDTIFSTLKIFLAIILIMLFTSLNGKTNDSSDTQLDDTVKSLIDKAFSNIASAKTGEKFLLEALKISKIKNPTETGMVYSEIAKFYKKTDRHKKRLEYLKKALIFYKKPENKKNE